MTVSAPSGTFEPVKILAILPVLIFLLKFCPAVILPANFKVVSFFLFGFSSLLFDGVGSMV